MKATVVRALLALGVTAGAMLVMPASAQAADTSCWARDCTLSGFVFDGDTWYADIVVNNGTSNGSISWFAVDEQNIGLCGGTESLDQWGHFAGTRPCRPGISLGRGWTLRASTDINVSWHIGAHG
ncbi:hypothetical protein ACQPXH_26765 [Nocardia sp. CA-135953]|uniref:hypothetical protein n=1 Tax=Nocardia sp. CA-135953 TaxID=3239978 RepID=UPI003D973BE5